MQIDVFVQGVQPRRLAAVRRRVLPGAVSSAWKPALDEVWAFIRERPALRTDGHNVFLYHHPSRPGEAMDVDFGVEITASFTPVGEVREATTPGGEAAVAIHRGAYTGLHAAHRAIHEWAKQNGRALGRASWEIYGDWSDDPSKLETTVVYLLR